MAKESFSLRDGMHLHLIGIGGAGISAIARVLLGRGFTVSGSDKNENELIHALRKEGATVFIGHDAKNLKGAEAVIVSSAIPDNNPEITTAKAAGIPVLKRAQFLGYLMADQIGIAVAGSHGKTTTTGMIAQILIQSGKDPNVILGGTLPEWGTNGRAGLSNLFVIEADEYDYMFLGIKPELAVITNIEHDHPDIFPTKESYQEAFWQFIELLPENGRLVISGDDPGIKELIEIHGNPKCQFSTYGLAGGNGGSQQAYDFQAVDLRSNQLGGTDFLVEHQGELIGLVRLRVPGEHNVKNALAAIAISLDLEVSFAQIQQALAAFGGVGRRFQVIGEVGGVTIIDDYAHHPTEIKATLQAARQRYPNRTLWAIWQPHTYSRTKLYETQFTESFTNADRVIVLEIYQSRETDDLGLKVEEIVSKMSQVEAIFIPDISSAVDYLLDRIHPDDIILTLGAGDGYLVGVGLLESLKIRVQTFRQ